MASKTLVGKIFGKYLITEHLGRGGMADVYKGYREDLDRMVAIKFMHPFLAADEDFIFRFKREARAMASMRHPNIATVHDFDIYEDDTYYLVMEYIGGGTLKDKLADLAQKGESMPMDQVLEIALALADALAYAHDQDMVHRDIKPGNIMLDESGRAILTDFGIVKLIGTQSLAFTATGALIGTPAYMSPEQALGKPGDTRSDIYSFGILLFQMLTGQLPFEADTPLAVVMKQVNEPPPLIDTFNPNVPPALQQIIFQAMAKEPEKRFQTATEFARALHMLEPSLGQRSTYSSTATMQPTKVEPVPTPAAPTTQPEPATVAPAEPTAPAVEPISSAVEPTSSAVEPTTPAASTVAPTAPAVEPTAPTVEPTSIGAATPPAGTMAAATQLAEPPLSVGQPEAIPPQDLTPKKRFPWYYAAGGFILLLAIAGGIFWAGRTPDNGVQPTATSLVVAVLPTATATEVSPLPVAEQATAAPSATLVPTTAPTEIPATATDLPTATATSTATATLIPTATPIPVPPGMVLIPAAKFIMGSNADRADEQPEHNVTLSAFFIDQFEVSNRQYQECVTEGGCTQVRSGSFTRSNYRDNPEFANHPVVGTSWNQAFAYCSWADKRLPTEAEWEYAASGPDKRVWPWGNSFDPNLSAASSADTQAVDSFPDGRSVFELFNMAGNVGEWVQDNYSTTFYAESDGSSNPVLENGGNTRVFRGGSFDNTNGEFYRTSRRFNQSAGFSEVDIGVRCAQTAP